jgi:hypothetical protein
MKTKSCTRIFVLTLLFFSFSAIAQDAPGAKASGTVRLRRSTVAAHGTHSEIARLQMRVL